jgi:putative FmdB family regulatory protein
MATYQYRCTGSKCPDFELSWSIHEKLPDVVECPNCNTLTTRRIWTAPATSFKGEGWGGSLPSRMGNFDIEDRR